MEKYDVNNLYTGMIVKKNVFDSINTVLRKESELLYSDVFDNNKKYHIYNQFIGYKNDRVIIKKTFYEYLKENKINWFFGETPFIKIQQIEDTLKLIEKMSEMDIDQISQLESISSTVTDLCFTKFGLSNNHISKEQISNFSNIKHCNLTQEQKTGIKLSVFKQTIYNNILYELIINNYCEIWHNPVIEKTCPILEEAYNNSGIDVLKRMIKFKICISPDEIRQYNSKEAGLPVIADRRIK